MARLRGLCDLDSAAHRELGRGRERHAGQAEVHDLDVDNAGPEQL
jgi:hypothetical protein